MTRISIVAAGVAFCMTLHWGAQGGRARDSGRRDGPPVATSAEKAATLIRAYPDHLDRLDGPTLVWKDGTRMVFDDGRTDKAFQTLLDAPDIEDQMAMPYPAEFPQVPPPRNFDPGRFRNAEFFLKMYGDCAKGEVAGKLASVPWLPKSGGRTLQVTTVNRVDERLGAVSAELDELPGAFKRFLVPAGGGYACRTIAGSTNRSPHGFGIAIDINPRQAEYWLWQGKTGYEYRNRVPADIMRIFEKHGFIWGGKWYHYDTMHFEYRPELLDRTQ